MMSQDGSGLEQVASWYRSFMGESTLYTQSMAHSSLLQRPDEPSCAWRFISTLTPVPVSHPVSLLSLPDPSCLAATNEPEALLPQLLAWVERPCDHSTSADEVTLYNHVLRVVIPKILGQILQQSYENGIPDTVSDFITRVLQIFVLDAERETLECAEMLVMVLNHGQIIYQQPRQVDSEDKIAGGTNHGSAVSKWTEALQLHQPVDYYDTTAQMWIDAWVTALEPDMITVHFESQSGKTMYHELTETQLHLISQHRSSTCGQNSLIQTPRLALPWSDPYKNPYLLEVVKTCFDLGIFEIMQKRIMDKEQPISIHVLNSYAQVVSTVAPSLDRELSQSLLPLFQKTTFACLDTMDEKHFKIITREITVDIMHACGKMLLPIHAYDEVCTIVEPFWLTLCLKCFSHPSLEKRIFAIDLMNDLISACHSFRKYPDGVLVEKRAQNTTINVRMDWMSMRHITCADLADCFVKNNLLQSLFTGPLAHVSLVERADYIIKFLEQEGSFGNQGVALMWSQAVVMHESHLRSICGLLGRCASELKHATLDHLSLLIMDTTRLSLVVVKLMGELAIAQETRAGHSTGVSMSVDESNDKASSLNFLWTLSVDEAASVAEPVAREAMEQFETVLKLEDYGNRTEWANRCIEKIKLGSAAVATKCLYLLHQILLAYPFKGEAGSTTRQKMIVSLQSHGDLLALVLRSLQHCRQVPVGSPGGTEEALKEEDLRQMVHTHLQFITFVIVNSSGVLQLGLPHVNTLWDCLVLQRQSPAELDWVCEWLEGLCKKQRGGLQVLDSA